MSKQPVGLLGSDGAARDSAADEAPGLNVRDEDAAAMSDDSGLLAAAALRRAEPGLESWTDMPPATTPKPRPIWLLIGVLWLSTALVTIGAVFAISALVG
jgi:hypothetical protein